MRGGAGTWQKIGFLVSLSRDREERATREPMIEGKFNSATSLVHGDVSRAAGRTRGDIGGQVTRGSRPIGAATGRTHLLDNGLGKGLTHDGRRGRTAAMATDVRSKRLGLWRKGEGKEGGGVVGELEVNPKAEVGGKMEGVVVAVENFQQLQRLVASGGAKFGRARTFGAGRG